MVCFRSVCVLRRDTSDRTIIAAGMRQSSRGHDGSENVGSSKLGSDGNPGRVGSVNANGGSAKPRSIDRLNDGSSKLGSDGSPGSVGSVNANGGNSNPRSIVKSNVGSAKLGSAGNPGRVGRSGSEKLHRLTGYLYAVNVTSS